MLRKYAAGASVRHARAKARENIIQNVLPFPIGFYQEILQGSIGTVLVLWRVPTSTQARSSSRQASSVLSASTHVKNILSRDQSRLLRKAVVEIGKSKGTLRSSSAAALLEAFGFSHVLRSREDKSRIAYALTAILGTDDNLLGLSKDSPVVSLTSDLRDYNCPKMGPKLSKFFEAASDFLDHKITPTGVQVDQRRAASNSGGARMYMPVAMSLPYLREQIRAHAESSLNLKHGVDFSLPSLEWLRLQFQPPREDNLAAARFSGLLGVHRAVQSRTIRQNHEDCHFVRALWQYIRQWCHPLAISGHATVVSVDDKCGVKIGEPEMPISALQRRQESSICVPSGNKSYQGTLAADHDYSVVTLPPSVTLFITPPQEPLASYARGAPYLTIKNAVFQSNPLRHAAELARSIRRRYQETTIPPVLVVFSDGGGDHRTNLYSVQLSFLYLMVELDLDEVVCARTAPRDSWINPAERRMAELNIAWESASFARMSALEGSDIPKDHAKWFEKQVKSAGSMAEIRKLVAHDDAKSNGIAVSDILNSSVRPVVTCMRESVERLQCEVNER